MLTVVLAVVSSPALCVCLVPQRCSNDSISKTKCRRHKPVSDSGSEESNLSSEEDREEEAEERPVLEEDEDEVTKLSPVFLSSLAPICAFPLIVRESNPIHTPLLVPLFALQSTETLISSLYAEYRTQSSLLLNSTTFLLDRFQRKSRDDACSLRSAKWIFV